MFINESKNNRNLESLHETFLDRWASEIREDLEKPRIEIDELTLRISDYKERIKFLTDCPGEFNNLIKRFTRELQKNEERLSELTEKCKPMEKILEIVEKAADQSGREY